MRWIFITLLLINTAYFVWQQQFAADQASVTAPHRASDKQLRLAAERGATPPLPSADQPQSQSMVAAQTPPRSVDVPATTTLAQVQAPAASERAKPRACYSIGPFLLVNDVSNTAKVFEGTDGIATQQRAAAERNQVGYWVYIPPLDSLQSARTVLRDLQKREIREVLIISEGEKANAISAGVYSIEGQAQERRAAISALGYQAEIDPLYRTQPQYWLDIELMKTQTLPAKLWQRVSRNFPNITKTEHPCE